MARPTQQEIDEWEARMNEPETPDPDDFEVVLFDANGDPVGTMPFARAKAYFAKRGIELDDPPAAGNAAPNGAPNAANANAGRQANPANSAGGPPIPPSAPRTRATSKYFGKPQGGGMAVDPNNLPAGSQPI